MKFVIITILEVDEFSLPTVESIRTKLESFNKGDGIYLETNKKNLKLIPISSKEEIE